MNLPDHLDLIATAPDGIQKLRGLILELAVRGKLVPQDPDDEPASELLRRIAQERARLTIRTPGEKKVRTLPSDDREWPFELPQGWEWEQFGEIAEIERGGSPRPIKSFLTDDPAGLNWIKIGDTDKGGKYITSTSEKIRREGLTKTRMVYPGDFLLTNSMSFGRPYITQIEGCIHDGWLRISPPKSLDKDYLYTLLSSPFVRKLFVNAAAGAVVMNLNADKVRELPIPLPPLAEQHRIVAKVDELMALCDRLETEQGEAASAHARLVDTLLSTLTQSTNAADLATNWQRLAEHFDTLFTTAASIDALKQTLLQLAVMGKLVPQDPNDEPASELLKRIAKERALLEAEGKIKKTKPLPPVDEDEHPFLLPESWSWCRFTSVTTINGSLVDSLDYPDAMQVAPDSIEKGTGKLLEKRTVRQAGVRGPNQRFQTGQLLYSKIRPSLSKAVLVDFDGLCSADMYPLDSHIAPQYLLNQILSETFLAQVRVAENRVKMPKLNQESLNAFLVCVPPLAEQHRIVAKVDELMTLCDRLKTDLATARQRQEQLAAGLIETALAA